MNQRSVESILSLKYAKAFIKINKSTFSSDDYKKTIAVINFFEKKFFFSKKASLQHYSTKKKLEFFALINKEFLLNGLYNNLCSLLINSQREALFFYILEHILCLYRKNQGIILFHLSSACAISENQKEKLIKFLVHKTKKVIIYTYTIDSTLISGFRAQSESLLWEYSVKKKLRMIHHSVPSL